MTPFIKWQDGKRRITAKIADFLPEKINTYYEPFLGGGGAMFFNLAAQKRIKRAFLSDVNPFLINAFRVVRDRPTDLMKELDWLQDYVGDREFFNRIRNDIYDRENDDIIQMAASFIFLNRAGYCGLWQVNREGRYNTPFFTNRVCPPRLYDQDNIERCSEALQRTRAKLAVRSFDWVLNEKIEVGDVVYFDPPYLDTISKYSAAGFTEASHRRLLEVAKKIASTGAFVAISNNGCDKVRELYTGLELHEVSVKSDLAALKPTSKKLKRSELIVIVR